MTPHLLFAFQGQPQGPGSSMFLFMVLAWVAIIYFLMIRPKRQQEKAHQARLAQLRKGDEVITAGGIMGKIVHLSDTQVTVKSDESKLLVARDRIVEINPGEKKTTDA